MIKIPVKLNKSKKEQIKRSYFDAMKVVGFHEQVYVSNKINTVTEILIGSTRAWKSFLGKCAVSMNHMYKEYFRLYDSNCIGWHDLGDARCLDCGEEDDMITRYESCKKRQDNLMQLKKFAKKDIFIIRNSSLAALFYLCNPYDVIPDYTPGIGYVDDAYVLNWGLSIIKRKSLRLFEQHFDI